MAIRVNIFSFFDPKGINNARKSFSALTDSNVASAKKQAIAMKLVGGAFATAGVAATAFATKLARDGVRAALEDEKSLAMLNKTLNNLGVGFNAGSVDNFINKLQFSTGVADDQLRPALNRLVLATGNLTQSQSLLNLALDVSAGTGKDLESVTVALAKAAGGQYTALQRLGVGLNKSVLESKDLDLITKSLTEKFSGQAQTAANTYAGKVQILSLAFNEFTEAIGYGALDAIDSITKALGFTTGGLAGSISDSGEQLGNLLRELGYTTAGLIKLTDELTSASDSNSWFSKTITAVTDNLVATNPRLEVFVGLLKLANLYGRETSEAVDPETFRNQQRSIQGLAEIRLREERARSAAEEARAEAEKEAEARAKEAQRRAEQEAKALEDRLGRLKEVSKDFSKTMAGVTPNTVSGSLDIASKSLDELRKLVSSTKYVTDDVAKNFTELASIVSSNLVDAFNMASSRLEDAKGKFNEFKNSISTTITGTIDFASAVEETDFLTGLEKQAEKATTFSKRLATLLQLGLSERALQQVLNTGADTGTKIADYIIAGGQTIVLKVNTLLDSVNAVAEEIGSLGASTFYSAGIAQGEAMVRGIMDAMASASSSIATLLSQLPTGLPVAQTTTIPQTQTTPTPSVLKQPPPKPKTGLAAASLQIQNKIKQMTNATRFADGGIVMGATNAIIGEAGPEAVIPLSGANSPKLGAVYNITVNAGIGTNGPAVGQQIVEAIKKYERTSGQVFARA